LVLFFNFFLEGLRLERRGRLERGFAPVKLAASGTPVSQRCLAVSAQAYKNETKMGTWSWLLAGVNVDQRDPALARVVASLHAQ
jgi:hypothetical protein